MVILYVYPFLYSFLYCNAFFLFSPVEASLCQETLWMTAKSGAFTQMFIFMVIFSVVILKLRTLGNGGEAEGGGGGGGGFTVGEMTFCFAILIN